LHLFVTFFLSHRFDAVRLDSCPFLYRQEPLQAPRAFLSFSSYTSTVYANILSENMTSQDLIQQVKDSLQRLNVQRQSLELEAEAIVSELTDRSNGEPMGVDTPLTDAEGFPRADIDVYRARTLRGRLSVIRTDHKGLMQNIERTLQQLAALQNPNKALEEKAELEARLQPKPLPKYDPISKKWVVKNWDGSVAGAPNGENRSFDNLLADNAMQIEVDNPVALASSITPANEQSVLPKIPSRPFARVNSVEPQSPAFQAGLAENDLILRFGNITLDETSDPMKSVGEIVPKAAAEMSSIPLTVRRNTTEIVTLHLSPRPWAGRGLLGCHIVPYLS
jgi:26S proteasome non-ATPase regulatory subunit 9